jgi:hypothetical protein
VPFNVVVCLVEPVPACLAVPLREDGEAAMAVKLVISPLAVLVSTGKGCIALVAVVVGYDDLLDKEIIIATAV